MRRLHSNPFMLSAAWIVSLSLFGCGGGGGGGGGGGAPGEIDITPSDNGNDDDPQESDVSASGLRDVAFTFSDTPRQSRSVEIGLSAMGTLRNVTWTLVSTPTDADAPFTVESGGLTASLTPDLPGNYELKVEARVDGKDALGTTRFRVREEFSYALDKVERESGEALDKIAGRITNQVFAFSTTASEAQLREVLTWYPEFDVLGFDDVEGLLLQFDDQHPDASDVLEELRSEPEVESVAYRVHEGENVPRAEFTPNDGSEFDDAGDNWHLEKIGALDAWEETTGSLDFLVGVVDSGFHASHEDMLGRFASAVLPSTPSNAAHGMGVAGAIGARTNNFRGISGINRRSKIVGTRYNLFGALDTVKNNRKVLLVNNSWTMAGTQIPGNFQPNNPAHFGPRTKFARDGSRKYRKAALGKYKDRLFIWSAGNGIGNGASTSDSNGDGVADNYGVLSDYTNGAVHLNDRGSLSRLENTIVVAAVARDNRLVYYSSYGNTVDIAAPTHYKSTNVVSAAGSQYYTGAAYGTNQAAGFSGTSAAAPVVTGAASLVFAADPKLTAKEVKKILLETATETATVRYTNRTGSTAPLAVPLPILNMGAAVKAATPPEVTIEVDAGAIVEGDQVFFNSTMETGLAPFIYQWDFGDGKTSSLGDDTHAYTRGGTYAVTLKVIDACDREATASIDVTVTVTSTGPDPDKAPEREDWVVWHTANVACWGAPLIYVTHRTGFDRESLRSSFPGGGIDPKIRVEKTEMQSGFETEDDAIAWLCPQVQGYRSHYWCGRHYVIGGSPYRFGTTVCDLSGVPDITGQ